MAANYAREKFTAGLYMLAEGQEDIRQRLVDAYTEASHGRSDKQLSPDFSKRIEALQQRMTTVPEKGEEGSIPPRSQQWAMKRWRQQSEKS